jgi:hypothetical protein
MLQSQKHSVKFLNRVPVHLTVTDLQINSLVTLPNWGLGIGFSYSQHSKIYQLLFRVAGFYSQFFMHEYSKFFLRSWIGRVKLINGSHILSYCLPHFMPLENRTGHWLRQCFGKHLQAAKKSFLQRLALYPQHMQSLLRHEN